MFAPSQIKAWSQITNKWDARLESLFTTADTDSNGNLDFKEFQGMMEKLRVDEMELPSERMILLMYSEMALYPRVDSKTFVRVSLALLPVLEDCVDSTMSLGWSSPTLPGHNIARKIAWAENFFPCDRRRSRECSICASSRSGTQA